jgi:hypothetical protein
MGIMYVRDSNIEGWSSSSSDQCFRGVGMLIG